jgi:hypothetical protein
MVLMNGKKAFPLQKGFMWETIQRRTSIKEDEINSSFDRPWDGQNVKKVQQNLG